MSVQAFSLWWVPRGEVLGRLQRVVDDLGIRFRTPVFVPHVTLVADIPGTRERILETTRKIARMIQTIPRFEFRWVETGDSYFQCVYVRAELTNVIGEAARVAREVVARDILQPYMPHLSLMYGDEDSGVTEQLQIQAVVRVKEILALPIVFIPTTIQVWTAVVPVKEWELVGEMVLR